MTPLVRLRGVTKTFTTKSEDVTPLRDLDLDVAGGEFLALMGPSGSGKTTLLNLVAGIDRPTAGTVEVGGEDVGAMSPRALARWRTRNVGFVFHQYNSSRPHGLRERRDPAAAPALSKAEPRGRSPWRSRPSGCPNARTTFRVRSRAVSSSGRGRGAPSSRVPGSSRRRADRQPRRDRCRRDPRAPLDAPRAVRADVVMVTHDPRAAAVAARVIRLDKGRILSDTGGTAAEPPRRVEVRDDPPLPALRREEPSCARALARS